MQPGKVMQLSDEKYNKLFANGVYYWIASAYNSYNLWNVDGNGNVNNYNYYESRCSTYSFSKIRCKSIN